MYIKSTALSTVSSTVDWQGRSIAWQASVMFAGTLVLALASYLAVPMVPVPVTMQTFAVVMIGALFGWRRGSITITAWLIEGALGFPVFANGTGGLLPFLGPTGGYLFAFPVVGALVGWLAERGCNGERTGLTFIAVLLGHAVCLIIGAAWLAVIVGPERAIAVGVVPFLIGALLKSALATVTLKMVANGKMRLFNR